MVQCVLLFGIELSVIVPAVADFLHDTAAAPGDTMRFAAGYGHIRTHAHSRTHILTHIKKHTHK
jgi:hypothetical protein